MSSSGYLQLGTAISGTVVVTPPSGTNYAGQPVTFDTFVGGIQLTSINCVFGPVSGAWGTLTCFGVTEDQAGTEAVVAPGTLQAPFTPVNGQLVVVPPGDMSLVVGAQFAAGPGFEVSISPQPLSYGGAVSGTVGTSSGQLVASGVYTRALLIQTAPGSVGNVWLNVTGGPASPSPTTPLSAAHSTLPAFRRSPVALPASPRRPTPATLQRKPMPTASPPASHRTPR